MFFFSMVNVTLFIKTKKKKVNCVTWTRSNEILTICFFYFFYFDLSSVTTHVQAHVWISFLKRVKQRFKIGIKDKIILCFIIPALLNVKEYIENKSANIKVIIYLSLYSLYLNIIFICALIIYIYIWACKSFSRWHFWKWNKSSSFKFRAFLLHSFSHIL